MVVGRGGWGVCERANLGASGPGWSRAEQNFDCQTRLNFEMVQHSRRNRRVRGLKAPTLDTILENMSSDNTCNRQNFRDDDASCEKVCPFQP